MIECALCRKMFDPKSIEAQGACQGCSLIGTGCGRVRCPYCGYENQRPLKEARERFKKLWRGFGHAAPHGDQ